MTGDRPRRRTAPARRRPGDGTVEAIPRDAPAAVDADSLASRPTAVRLAHLHLRMGSLALARAELELIAAGGVIDSAGLVDLAEARWRSGDLAGAGAAAGQALDHGTDDPVALVIAAEAAAAAGRREEAESFAAAALAGLETTLDALFAGMPRSHAWPGDREPEPVPVAVLDQPLAADAADATQAAAAADAMAAGRRALADDDAAGAVLGLSLALRLDPRLAEEVLDAIGDRSDVPLLALVAGDALRLLGREGDAREAYARASAAGPGATLDADPGAGGPDPA